MDVAVFLVARYQDEVGELIASTVAAWDPELTSRRVELAIGRDLQFIRINGTIVGGLAGMLDLPDLVVLQVATQLQQTHRRVAGDADADATFHLATSRIFVDSRSGCLDLAAQAPPEASGFPSGSPQESGSLRTVSSGPFSASSATLR